MVKFPDIRLIKLTSVNRRQALMTASEISPEPPKAGKSNLVKQLIGAAIAILLLYLAFKNVDGQKLWQYSKEVSPVPVLMVVVISIISHLLRAYRWTFLLKPLAQRRIGLFNAFYAVILGYAVNVAIPRGGEVARLLSICKEEKLPWAGVLPTMLIDRMLDVALLVFLLGSCLLVLPKDLLGSMPALIPSGIALLIATIIGLILLPQAGTILKKIIGWSFVQSKVPKHLTGRLDEIAGQFDTGTQALKNPVIYPLIALLSFLIWFCYGLNFYFMIQAFHLSAAVDAVKCLIVFTIGSASMLVPTPGGVGSFHVLITQTLMAVAPSIPYEQALAFATYLHILSLVLISCVTALVLFIYKKAFKK